MQNNVMTSSATRDGTDEYIKLCVYGADDNFCFDFCLTKDKALAAKASLEDALSKFTDEPL